MAQGTCSVNDAECSPSKNLTAGYCNAHYLRVKRHGDPLGPPCRDESLPAEEWRPIPGYAGCYEASGHGRVRSLSRISSSGRTIFGRVLRATGKPYLTVNLCVDGNRRVRPVHQLVAEAFHGLAPDGMEVRHLDDDKLNNTAANLTWGTRSENIQDRIANGIMYQLNRTHCVNNHLWTPETTFIARRPDGSFKQRVCRICRVENKRKLRARQREAAAAA